jgi:DinB superfamily
MTVLTEQLARIEMELGAAQRHAHAIADPLEDEEWTARPAPNQWSVMECLIHLNRTSRAFLPLIREAIGRGRDEKLLGAGPYRRDFVGWLLTWAAKTRLPIKTTDPFVPTQSEPRDKVLSEFDALQHELIARLAEADGLLLGRLRIVSPFDARIRYNLYSCLGLIPAHQRQHLEQAGRVLRKLKARRNR